MQLPIKSSSVVGVHAGAALHCLIHLDVALQEVLPFTLTTALDVLCTSVCRAIARVYLSNHSIARFVYLVRTHESSARCYWLLLPRLGTAT